MTVIAIVHPDRLPTLLSDLVVSKSATKLITPSKPSHASESGHDRVQLMRKSITFNNDAVVLGFAGPLDLIDDFEGYLRSRLNSESSMAVPIMRKVGDIANGFNDLNKMDPLLIGLDPISVVGFCAMPPDMGLGIHYVDGFYGSKTVTSHFNQVIATGTGSSELLKMIHKFDSQITMHHKEGGQVFTTPGSKLIGILGALNAEKLFSEPSDPNSDTWGGYIEATTLVNYSAFQPTPSWSHLCYIALKEGLQVTVMPFRKQYHYSRQHSGSVMGMFHHDNSESDREVTWPIFDFLDLDEGEEQTPFNWRKFIPDSVTVSVKLPQYKKTIHKTLNRHEHDQLFSCGPMEWGLPNVLVEAFANDCFSSLETIFSTQ